MKMITMGLLFVLASTASAYDISLRASDCTMFGNMKIKVNGLENLGPVASGYLKNKSTSRNSCEGQVSKLRDIFDNQSVYADAKITKRIVKRNFSIGRDRDRLSDRRDDRCEETEVTTLTMNIPAYSDVNFTNTSSRFLRTYRGRCY